MANPGQPLSDSQRRLAGRSCDLCLVVPPFDDIAFPTLGPSILATACRERGLEVTQIYGGMPLAARIGYSTYKAICKASRRTLLGDRLFVPHAYPPEQREKLGPQMALDREAQAIVDRAADPIGPFLEELVCEILSLHPRIVGFSSSFQQTLAAAALARVLKERAPEIRLVLGGANAAMPMGGALMQVFPWFDHVFCGEADVEFPAFCERVLRGGHTSQPRLIECDPVKDMSAVCAPDFSDYFASLRAYQRRGQLPADLPEFLPLESSRGCWWGEKHHCTFCGLNGETMTMRQKPAARVMEEIKETALRWQPKRLQFADNIMPVSYFKDLLPALSRLPQRPSLFYEVKSNLRDDQIETMADAGIDAIQPGIESFSTGVLRLMRKGVSGPQNLALLRSCLSKNISVNWNYLFGFPGETAEDYERVLALLPCIEHLPAPSGLGRIIIDRFSPYHNDPARFGIAKLSPFKAYYGLYPQEAPVSDIAYHFRGRYTTALIENRELLAAFRGAIDRWVRLGSGRVQIGAAQTRPVLRIIDAGGSQVAIADTRSVSVEKLTAVSRAADEALRYFEKPRPRDGLPDPIACHVEALMARHFVIAHEGMLVSVVARMRSVVLRSSATRNETASEPALTGEGCAGRPAGSTNARERA